MQTFTLQVRVQTKYGQHHSDTVYYPANNWTQAIAKAKRYANEAYGYNNITNIQIEGIK
jgi:hypothetical protein